MSKSPFHLRYWPTWLALGLLRLFTLLPYPLLIGAAAHLGKRLNRLLPHRRHVVEVNIDLCFPELTPTEKAQMVEAVMVNTTQGIFETALSWWAPERFIRQRCHIDGLELLDQYTAQGRGVVLIGAHYTTLDLAGRVIGSQRDMDITYKAQKNPAFDYCINHYRKRFFRHLIEKNEMRKMVKNLKAGRIVWYAPDQDFGRRGSVFAPFFGHPAATITTIGKLVKLTGAKPLFYSHFRIGEGASACYQGRIHDPFGENFADDDVANATLLNQAIEAVIRQHPAQYFWVHERFRTQPERNAPAIYPRRKKRKKRK